MARFFLNQRVRVRADARPDRLAANTVKACGREGTVRGFLDEGVVVEVDGIEAWVVCNRQVVEPLKDPRAAQFIAEMNKYEPAVRGLA